MCVLPADDAITLCKSTQRGELKEHEVFRERFIDLHPQTAYVSNAYNGSQESICLTNTLQQNMSAIFFFNICHYGSHEKLILLHQLFLWSSLVALIWVVFFFLKARRCITET